MSFRMKCCCSLLLTFIASLSAWGQGQELRYKFAPGGKNSYVMEQAQNMKMSVNGQDFEIKMNMMFEMTQAVDSVDTATGTAKIKQKIDRVKMTMEGGPIGMMEYDSKSDKEPDGPLAAMAGIFKAMTEGEMKMTMNTRGEVSDFKMPEKLIDELKNISGGAAGGFGGNMFSEDALKNMFNQSSLILPKEVAVAGETTWNRNMDMKLGAMGTMKNNTKYTYVGKSGEFDKIDMKMDMKMEPDPNAPMQINMKTKEASGNTLFDNAKGRIQEISVKTVSEMEMGQFGTANVSQTMKMKLK
ncbi:MAG TPA: DUF6263 family protein [Gemmatales bacterium]|nr:DUF6263 family protein [Gemmatales bacterium]